MFTLLSVFKKKFTGFDVIVSHNDGFMIPRLVGRKSHIKIPQEQANIVITEVLDWSMVAVIFLIGFLIDSLSFGLCCIADRILFNIIGFLERNKTLSNCFFQKIFLHWILTDIFIELFDNKFMPWWVLFLGCHRLFPKLQTVLPSFSHPHPHFCLD